MNVLLTCLLLVSLQAPVQNPGAPAKQAQSSDANAIYFSQQGDGKSPVTLEQAITQALANHPDMRLAEAELRVAEAKLAQARIHVSQKVAEDYHSLEKARTDVEAAKASWERFTELLKRSAVSQEEVREAQRQLASAKARLAAAESSWNLLMGKPTAMVTNAEVLNREFARYLDVRRKYADANAALGFFQPNAQAGLEFYRGNLQTSSGGTTDTIDQLKTHLEVKVKLEKQTNLELDQAFKKVSEGAGLKVRVKLPITENKIMYRDVTRLDLDANEFALHTWLQLIVDEMNNQQALTTKRSNGQNETPKRFELYVREYGLLLTSQDLAPADAITVQELLKQIKFEKAAKLNKKAAESEAPKK